MSTLSQFFSSGGGPHTSNPKQLTRVICDAAALALRQQSTESLANGSTFFTALTANVNTDWVADTYKTIVSTVSGAGFVSAMVGPTAPSSMTTTFSVEIDGVTTVYAISSVPTGSRAILGRVRGRIISATDPRDTFADISSVASAGTLTSLASGGNGTLVLSPTMCHALGLGMLRYETSFTLQMKTSVAITATAANERRCGAMYTTE